MKKLLIFVLALVSTGWAQTSATGALTVAGATCTGNGSTCANLVLNDPYTGAVGIDISGTFVGTGQVEASIDGKALDDATKTWRAISVTPVASTTTVTSFTAGGAWRVAVSGVTDIRIRCSAYTSGTIVVAMRSSRQAASLGGGTSLPALSDNGTVVTSTERLNITAAADATTAAVQFNSVTTTGLMFGAATYVGLKVDATNWMGISNNNNGPSTIQAPSSGCIGWSSTATFAGNINDTGFCRNGAANSVRLGLSGATSTPLANSLQIGDTGSGADKIGGSGSVKPGIGTGAGAGTQLDFSRNLILATSSTTQSQSHALVVCESKILSNTSATTTTLATIGLASNSGGGAEVHISVVASDGTNFDVETQSATLSFVNKATVMTVSTPTITASSAASNTGSTTIGFTATGASPTISLKVTPVFTTIVPTTVTAYMEVLNHGAGAVACQ